MESAEPFPEPLPQPAGNAEAAGTTTSDDPPVRRPVRCRLCGRPLIGAGSRRKALGPSCDAKLHPAPPDIRTRRHEVDQDPLPGI
ncbi:DUF6011 domain-containing protein [Streptomyces sp. BE308]|uniref:DUF6011 domain-containing protein n=1 Tax=Streptomyces sp. BE308 TaxID=3002529 RepID=UPI002E77D53A|nr:DUF6011 domain-containing protein [Streptomyces sp. BE308]MEE1793488.1 DUF6011 domain-containing protein [Streptomyces sp. BE308]